MTRLAVAAPTRASADAARWAASGGGSAVDAMVAAAAVAAIDSPGVCAPGAGAFIVIGTPDGTAGVLDGYLTVPGIGGGPQHPVVREVRMEYGGGVTTIVGPGSIATPGVWAALEDAHRQGGRLPWNLLLFPAVDLATSGFLLPPASRHYLDYAFDPVFSSDVTGRQALAVPGVLEGLQPLVVPGLAESLRTVADEGSAALHGGELGRRIVQDVSARGGSLTPADLDGYRVEARTPVTTAVDGWTVFTNPPPAVGGISLIALLEWTRGPGVSDFVDAQRRLVEWRRDDVVTARDRVSSLETLLAALPGRSGRAPSTVHISVVDEAGTAVAITMSAGYGSGVIPAGTGWWMNNGLGEVELRRDGDVLEPGARLNSNMAPAVVVSPGGGIAAIGSPGADRISTAMASVIRQLARGATPAAAVGAPRVHVEWRDGPRVAAEPGVEMVGVGYPVRRFDGLHMFFGGVGIALRHADGRLEAVADPRRQGTALVTE